MQSQRSQHKIYRVGKYELTGETFGKGNYSKVHEAIDREKNIRVALKIVDLSNAKDSYIKRHYKREAILLTKLKHPNIIRLYNFIDVPEKSFILALEAMPENLCDFIRRQCNGRLEESLARVLFRQMASAISFMHDMGVIHRDIKLENILYDRITQQIKLTDFGLSNHWDKNELLKTNCGSPEYSAPELHACRPYDSAVDVWALGVVLFAMVVGRLPFDIARKKPVSNQHRREMFLEETKRGMKTQRHQQLLYKCSYGCKDLTSLMLNPDEHARIKMHEVEKHHWIVIKKIVIPQVLQHEHRTKIPSRKMEKTATNTSKMNAIKKSSNIAHRPITANTTPLSRQPTTPMCSIVKTKYLERPTTQVSQFRTLKPSSIYGYENNYERLRQKYGSFADNQSV